MVSQPSPDPRFDEQLFLKMLDPAIKDNPLAWVMFAFPWGKPNTPLAHFSGPRKWQQRVLQEIGAHIAENQRRGINGISPEVFRKAVASGRGIGKSALVSWLVLWMLTTRFGSTVIVSANTESQLKRVTWSEIGKWLTLAIHRHWFDMDSTSVRPAGWLSRMVSEQLSIDPTYWYADAKLWKEENPDAYAGVHNMLGMLLIFDEASGIPPSIWKVSEGYFTEPIADRYQFAFSNPRRNQGTFFECFHANRNYWLRDQIDARTVEGTDQKTYAKIITQYGEDHDVTRVEVKGMFPRQGDRQFISTQLVADARARVLEPDGGAPLIMGVDVARFGDDRSVIRFRAGRDARSGQVFRFKGVDTQVLAAHVMDLAQQYNPDAIVIDGGGVGGGVVDRCKALGLKVFEFDGGSRADDEAYKNKRVEVWARMRDWLPSACLPDDDELATDITGPEYDIDPTTGQLKLESKESMKKRGMASPDDADALAMTFAVKVARRDMAASRGGRTSRMARDVDYAIFG